MANPIDVNLQGWPVLRIWRGAVYLRLPENLQRPIDGGCGCDYCKSHPLEVPSWDTVGVPLQGQRKDTWTLHAPEWRPTDRIDPVDAKLPYRDVRAM